MTKETIGEKPENLLICPPISPNDLIGITYTDPYGYNLPFGERPIDFYVVRNGADIDLIGVQKGNIGGRRINQLLHSIKPKEAGFDIDTPDLLDDWTNIDNPENAERLAKHAKMPGWSSFYREKDQIRDLIRAEYIWNGKWVDEIPDAGFTGVMWWRLGIENGRTIILDKLADFITKPGFRYIVSAYSSSPDEANRLSTIVGTWLLAFFSPEIREDEQIWKPRDSYGGECRRLFNMGTTQVGAMAIRYAQAFSHSRFSDAALEYASKFSQTPEV